MDISSAWFFLTFASNILILTDDSDVKLGPYVFWRWWVRCSNVYILLFMDHLVARVLHGVRPGIGRHYFIQRCCRGCACTWVQSIRVGTPGYHVHNDRTWQSNVSYLVAVVYRNPINLFNWCANWLRQYSFYTTHGNLIFFVWYQAVVLVDWDWCYG